jgi:hypothetical protein
MHLTSAVEENNGDSLHIQSAIFGDDFNIHCEDDYLASLEYHHCFATKFCTGARFCKWHL